MLYNEEHFGNNKNTSALCLSQTFFPALPLSPLARIQCHMWLSSSSHRSQHVTPAHDIIWPSSRQSFPDLRWGGPLKRACCVTQRLSHMLLKCKKRHYFQYAAFWKLLGSLCETALVCPLWFYFWACIIPAIPVTRDKGWHWKTHKQRKRKSVDCMCVFVCVLVQMGVDERLLSGAVNVIHTGINRQASLPCRRGCCHITAVITQSLVSSVCVCVCVPAQWRLI